jgi:E3 ubiquitin-protein ligase listerin
VVQDGTILEALQLWKKNLDKEFEGVEPCPICYSVIHMTNKSLPRLQCGVCRNKYHSNCLQKWFQTANKNNCPMCQQPISL